MAMRPSYQGIRLHALCDLHAVMELILQNAVGFAQDGLAALVRMGLPDASSMAGTPIFAVADLHDGLLDGTGQWGIFAVFRPENLLFDDRVQLLGAVVLLFVPGPMMFLVELASRMAGCIAVPNFHDGTRRMLHTIAKGFAMLLSERQIW